MVIQDQQIGELLSVVLKARKWGDMKGEGIDVGQLQRIWFELITFFFLEVSVRVENINVRGCKAQME